MKIKNISGKCLAAAAKAAIKWGENSSLTSSIFGLYEPKIPERLKKKTEKE